MRVWNLQVAALAAALCIATVSPAASAKPLVQPAGTTHSLWAWAVDREPGLHQYTPPAGDAGNSVVGAVHIGRVGPGHHIAFFDNNSFSVAHVTALAGGARICIVKSTAIVAGSEGESVGVEVICHAHDGTPRDTPFVVSGLSTQPSVIGDYGYLLSRHAARVGTETPGDQYDWNGGTVTVHHSTTPGSYVVTFPGMGEAGGNVQVTAYGAIGSCSVVEWSDLDPDLVVDVQCRSPNGTRQNSLFMLTFTDEIGLKGEDLNRQAYFWADRPHAPSYQPSPFYLWASNAGVPTIHRSSVGDYAVSIPGMPNGGAVQVSAYGGAATICHLTSIATTGAPPLLVGVRCFDSAGARTDSQFTLSYEN